ncbi:MAG: hypothetical protein R2795_13915 [Saprospiraceae bacterium]
MAYTGRDGDMQLDCDGGIQQLARPLKAVYIDALAGNLVAIEAATCNALNRRVYDIISALRSLDRRSAFPAALALNNRLLYRQVDIVTGFFHHAFGMDSYDGSGAQMKGVSNAACPTVLMPTGMAPAPIIV